MSLFVAGTDTGVGKTLVCALLLARYRRERQLGYWKPVATGADVERDRTTVEALVPDAATMAEAYLFADPLSPHLAARRCGQRIELPRIVSRWRELRATFPDVELVVEGAGGLLVPLDEEGPLLVDLIAALELPVLLVGRSTLGTINHTLLSLEALRQRELVVAGVVLSGPLDSDNRQAIERLGGVEVLAEVPPLAEVDAAAVAAAAAGLDAAGALRPWLARAS
ncbi:MAG TPA: dethiobiotin synthase [Thermoanaerobaculia bacterium]|jgi:malonyl-CoA O-methyltransferase|nr:dethiobiotin synthase [Thermoanaerobaculia bacterium]